MPGGKIFLAAVLECGEAAKNEARKYILKGSTQPKNNKLSPDRFQALDDGVDGMRNFEDAFVKERLASSSIEEKCWVRFNVTLEMTSKFSLGSCHELAFQALDYILENYPSINAELFVLSGGDHEFLVLNREVESDPNDPRTWGDNAVICDPWANKVFKASEYRSELRAYVYDKEHKKNYTTKFNPQMHTLDATVYSTTYLRQVSTIDHLKRNFFDQAKSVISDLQGFKTRFEAEKERLQEKPEKASVISNKIRQINAEIQFLDNLISYGMKKEYLIGSKEALYQEANSDLMDTLNAIKHNANMVMQFCKVEKDILYQHSNLLQRTRLLGATDTETNLEQIAEEASQQFRSSNPQA